MLYLMNTKLRGEGVRLRWAEHFQKSHRVMFCGVIHIYSVQVCKPQLGGGRGDGTKNCLPRNGLNICNIKMDLEEGANYIISRIDLNFVLIVLFQKVIKESLATPVLALRKKISCKNTIFVLFLSCQRHLFHVPCDTYSFNTVVLQATQISNATRHLQFRHHAAHFKAVSRTSFLYFRLNMCL